jgi:hypothetical protein
VHNYTKVDLPKPDDLSPMRDAAAQAVRVAVLERLASDPYIEDRARYRVAVHPAATWIRDELFRRALGAKAPEGRYRIVFTAGGNAAGKTIRRNEQLEARSFRHCRQRPVL